ncbi:hypothetical protein Tco_0969857, partial [Tanacetum coccineum]
QAAGVGLVLWGDLKVLMDSPKVNDVNGLVVRMFVDKKYPLSVHLIERMLDHQLEICQETVVASPEQTAIGKDTSNPFMASSMDLTLSGPCLDADFLVADSKYMKVAFGDIPTGSVVPTGKDSSIVSTGSTKVIPTGSTILVPVVLCLLRVDSKS